MRQLSTCPRRFRVALRREPSYEEPSLTMDETIHLQAVTPTALAELLPVLLPVEARRVVSIVHRTSSLPKAVQGVRRVAMDAVHARGVVKALTVEGEETSGFDAFRKLAVSSASARDARDGGAAQSEVFETVRIPLEKPGRFTICVSSQIGCGLACRFCATGRMGLKRNLEVWEIIEQVRLWKPTLPADVNGRIHGVVFQGMGEPLSNYDRVIQAIHVLSDPSALAIDARNITVTTAGLPSGIRKLAEDAPNVRLGWSIGSAVQARRPGLMPIAGAHHIDDVLRAVIFHAQKTNIAPLWAITPLAGVNDTEADVRALSEMVHAFFQATAMRPRISVIPYNTIGDDDPYVRQSDEALELFRARLRAQGVFAKLRYSGGGEVSAACGQLAAKHPVKPQMGTVTTEATHS